MTGKQRVVSREARAKWRRAVLRGKTCAGCGKSSPGMDPHHVIQQQVLRHEFPFGVKWDSTMGRWVPRERWDDSPFTRALEELLCDPANGVALCSRCHEGHTSHMGKLPLERVPPAAIKFALSLGLEHRLGARFYRPVAT